MYVYELYGIGKKQHKRKICTKQRNETCAHRLRIFIYFFHHQGYDEKMVMTRMIICLVIFGMLAWGLLSAAKNRITL